MAGVPVGDQEFDLDAAQGGAAQGVVDGRIVAVRRTRDGTVVEHLDLQRLVGARDQPDELALGVADARRIEGEGAGHQVGRIPEGGGRRQFVELGDGLALRRQGLGFPVLGKDGGDLRDELGVGDPEPQLVDVLERPPVEVLGAEVGRSTVDDEIFGVLDAVALDLGELDDARLQVRDGLEEFEALLRGPFHLLRQNADLDALAPAFFSASKELVIDSPVFGVK